MSHGYTFEMRDGKVLAVEGDSKAWRSMQSFAERFPRGDEPEWGGFAIKHTAMQNAESEAAWRAFYRGEIQITGAVRPLQTHPAGRAVLC